MNSRARDDDVEATGGCVSLSLSHDSSGGPDRTTARPDRASIDRSVGRVDRSIDRSSVVHACTYIDTYIIINIPYQYTPSSQPSASPLNPTPVLARLSRHVISFVVSSSSSSNLVVARPTAIDDERDDEIRRSRSSSSSRASVDRSSDDDDDDG